MPFFNINCNKEKKVASNEKEEEWSMEEPSCTARFDVMSSIYYPTTIIDHVQLTLKTPNPDGPCEWYFTRKDGKEIEVVVDDDNFITRFMDGEIPIGTVIDCRLESDHNEEYTINCIGWQSR